MSSQRPTPFHGSLHSTPPIPCLRPPILLTSPVITPNTSTPRHRDASLTPADIDDRAGKLGMNVSKLDQCVSSDRFADIIQRSISEASAMQVSGASPFEAFKAAIDPLLAAAN